MVILTKERGQIGSHRIDQFDQLAVAVLVEEIAIFGEILEAELTYPPRQA